MTPKTITAPTVEPISVDEARSHLEAPRYGESDIDPADDLMIEAWITAAREHCEDFLGLSLSVRTLEIALDTFPDDGAAITLPLGPVIEVVSITVGDGTDAETVDAEDYVLDDYAAQHCLKPVTAWPSVTSAPNAVKVRYLAGYGDESDGAQPLPAVFRSAMLLVIGHLYENRAEATEKAMSSLPLGVHALLRPRRVRLGMA